MRGTNTLRVFKLENQKHIQKLSARTVSNLEKYDRQTEISSLVSVSDKLVRVVGTYKKKLGEEA